MFLHPPRFHNNVPLYTFLILSQKYPPQDVMQALIGHTGPCSVSHLLNCRLMVTDKVLLDPPVIRVNQWKSLEKTCKLCSLDS